MRISPELEAALEAVHGHLDPGQRVPDAWEELPEKLRDQLKISLAGSTDVRFEDAFAEFVHAYLRAYRSEKSARRDVAGR